MGPPPQARSGGAQRRAVDIVGARHLESHGGYGCLPGARARASADFVEYAISAFASELARHWQVHHRVPAFRLADLWQPLFAKGFAGRLSFAIMARHDRHLKASDA